jgi:hypothetical protein
VNLNKYFQRWLNKNIDKFTHKPIEVGYCRYIFNGITSHIELYINNRSNEVEIQVLNHNELVDIIFTQFIYRAKHIKNKGYTDLSWINEYKNRFYSTYQDMIYVELFEPLVNYSNNIFIPKNDLYLIYSDGYTEAIICDKNNTKIAKLKEKQTKITTIKLINN